MTTIHSSLNECQSRALDSIACIGEFKANATGSLTYVDKRWCDIAGMESGDALGSGWMKAIHPDDQLFVSSNWQHAIQDRASFDYEFRFVNSSNAEVWVHASACANLNDSGDLSGFSGFMVDITRRRHAEQALEGAKALLVKSERFASLGMLIADIAHEISNPVSFVHSGAENLDEELSNFTDFLLELTEGEENARVRKIFEEKLDTLSTYCRTIIDGSSRIKSFVGDLRNYSNLDKREQQQISIAALLQATLRLIKLKYKDFVDFRLDVAFNPEIECSPDQLNQVFMNIMINACQAMQKKHKTIPSSGETKESLLVQTFQEDDQLGIRFKDTGCGIQAHHLEHIFDPFFTTKPNGEGTGLGLSISSEIIARHGGSISVDSTVGKGTTMIILLPLSHHTTGLNQL